MSHFNKIVKKVTMIVQLTKIENPEEESGIPENELIKTENEEGDKFYNGYKLLDYLGEGAFSKVKLVEKNNQKYAMKVINRKKLMSQKKGFGFKLNDDKVTIDNSLEDAMREIAILKKCNHKNVIKLYEILHDNKKNKLYLILEYVQNGTIMIYNEDEDTFQINEHFYKNNDPNSDYTEDEIRKIIRQIILGIDYLHNNGVIHRDIKPDNILLNENNKVKITDFNLSALLTNSKEDIITKGNLGTKYFRAPEVCKDENENSNNMYIHGKPLDIWALGVVSYLLAYKKLPFVESEESENPIDLYNVIINKNYEIPNNRMSKGFIDFLSKCLNKNPYKRITITEIKKLDWINEKGYELPNIKLPPKIEVSINEIKGSISFFIKVKLMKIKSVVQKFKQKFEEKYNEIDKKLTGKLFKK